MLNHRPLAESPDMLIDRHGRSKRKLRISLTDRCNFRCGYCMPTTPEWLPSASLLRRAEIVRLAGLFVGQGIDQIRLTGGEPLMRRDLVDCVRDLQRLRHAGLTRLSMTTNASFMAGRAAALVEAGIDDFNVSLDTVDPAIFQRMTGRPLAPVLAGIDDLLAAGAKVKLNAVITKGDNDDDLVGLLEWAMAKGLSLRLIEYMPLDSVAAWRADAVVSEAQMLALIETRHAVRALPRSSEPASPYLIDERYPLGIISTVSNPFCSSCDRLRLTATGELFTCLFSRFGTPLGVRLREGVPEELLTEHVRHAVWRKDAGYAASPGPVDRTVTMHAMGG
jgi:GTP 3',8-cyclase